MEYFKFLPVEIVLDILSRLPVESVLECKLVSTNWRSLIRHSSFSKMNLHHLKDANSGKFSFVAQVFKDDEYRFHYFEHDEKYNHESTAPIQGFKRINLTSPSSDTVFVGSCNGLICFARGPSVEICNLITKEHVVLPEIVTDYQNRRYWTIGFGYVSSTCDYKVVGIRTDVTNSVQRMAGENLERAGEDSVTDSVQAYIYTLGGGNGWRKLGNFNLKSSKERLQSVFANGALYWLDRELHMIITFDLAGEKFGNNLSLPSLPPGSNWLYNRIGVLDGFLYTSVSPEGGRHVDIWLSKRNSVNHEMEEQEEHESSVWSKEFEIGKSILFAITKSDGILTYDHQYLSIFDTNTSTSKRLVKIKNWIHRVFPHTNTFVSLAELGEEDTKPMRSVEIEETRRRDYTFMIGGCEP